MTRSIGWNVVAYMLFAALVTSLILTFTISNALWDSRTSGLSFLSSEASKTVSALTITEANRGPLFQPATVIPKTPSIKQEDPTITIPVPAVVPKAASTPTYTNKNTYTYKVTSFFLNVRSKPDASSEIVDLVKQGALLQVKAVTPEGWLALKGGGYVHGGYAELISASADSKPSDEAAPVQIAASAASQVKDAKSEVAAASVSIVPVRKAVPAKINDYLTRKPKAGAQTAINPSKPVRPTTKVSSDSGLTAKHIEKILAGTKLSGHGLENAILAVEDKYGINAFFTIAVMKLESGNGKSKLAINKNNLFGLNAVTGKSAYRKAFTFATKGDSVRKFGQLLSDNYVERGLTTIEKVAKKYCPANGRWPGLVRSIMKSDYNKLV
ncbi:glucosaminidase domain-containing protein [Paenibacillus montanisoli]|uniref:Uncharacterized protein n=1 Tax=Paenibacillus montanisoli TaxID=2081970 RepID=A0A328UEJ0_9BACL|nr:glucosaminidase domain-containing protein [Paenibacillus montanisoli]RAP78366.1 hypothetical protein DL346_08060 [Paenibacillus montanisoli]